MLFDTDVALNKVIVAMDTAPITSANWQYKPELRGAALILKIPHSSHDLLNGYSVVFTSKNANTTSYCRGRPGKQATQGISR